MIVLFGRCLIFELYIGYLVGIMNLVVFVGCWLSSVLIIFGIMLFVWCMIMVLLIWMFLWCILFLLCSVVLVMVVLLMNIGLRCVIGVIVLVWLICMLIVMSFVSVFCVGNLCVSVKCGVCDMKLSCFCLLCWLIL